MTIYFVLGVVVFVMLVIIIGVVGAVLYLFYLPFKKRWIQSGRLTTKWSKQINKAYIIIIVLFALYLTLDAFFLGESFYKGEFETVTLRKMPESAKFIENASSYPDFHGDYCSSSQIRLSKADYMQLLESLNADNRIAKNREIIGSEEFSKTLKNKSRKKIVHSFTRQIEGEEDHYLYIGFYNDAQTIFVNVCVD